MADPTQRPGSLGSPQRISERTSERRYFFLLPNLADDAQLDVFAFRLLAHYKRVAGEQGVCTETTRDTAAHCGMSPRKVVDARGTLAQEGWIETSIEGPVGQQIVIVTLIDRMAENVARYSRPQPGAGLHGMQAEGPAPSAGAPHASPAADPLQHVRPSTASTAAPRLHQVQPPPAGRAGYRKNTQDPEDRKEHTTPSPHTARQQQGVASEVTVAETTPGADAASANHESHLELVHRFYAALGAGLEQLTPALLKRELAIAAQLAGIGATPAEAEAYARDMLAARDRLAPLDLRSFERERLSWQARRQPARNPQRHLVDRTGETSYPPGSELKEPTQSAARAPRAIGADATDAVHTSPSSSRAGALARSLFGGVRA